MRAVGQGQKSTRSQTNVLPNFALSKKLRYIPNNGHTLVKTYAMTSIKSKRRGPISAIPDKTPLT